MEPSLPACAVSLGRYDVVKDGIKCRLLRIPCLRGGINRICIGLGRCAERCCVTLHAPLLLLLRCRHAAVGAGCGQVAAGPLAHAGAVQNAVSRLRRENAGARGVVPPSRDACRAHLSQGSAQGAAHCNSPNETLLAAMHAHFDIFDLHKPSA